MKHFQQLLCRKNVRWDIRETESWKNCLVLCKWNRMTAYTVITVVIVVLVVMVLVVMRVFLKR